MRTSARGTPDLAGISTVALAEHRAVTEAIRNRDAEAARVAMLAHRCHDVVRDLP